MTKGAPSSRTATSRGGFLSLTSMRIMWVSQIPMPAIATMTAPSKNRFVWRTQTKSPHAAR